MNGFIKRLFVFGSLLVFNVDASCDSSNESIPDYEQIAIEGKNFKPREFWSQPIKDQLLYLSNTITANNLPQIVFNNHKYVSPLVTIEYAPYTELEGTKFRTAIWNRLIDYVKTNNIKLSKKEFFDSLTDGIPKDSYVYKAPLIYYFEQYLCKTYDKNFVATPSFFENLINHTDKQLQ